MNRNRLALSLAIVGILISPALFRVRVWDSWLQAYNDFGTYQDISAYNSAIDAAKRKGATEEQFFESIRKECEALQPNENSEEARECLYRIRKDRIGAPLSSYLSALAEVLIRPWLFAIAIGGVGGAVLGYVLPPLVRFTLVGVPAVLAAYVRWLREPE